MAQNQDTAKTQLERFIRTHVKNPKEVEVLEILEIFEERTYAKGEVFKKAHTIATHVGFLVSGSAKTIIVKDDGDEILGRMITSGHFLFDLISARNQEKTAISFKFSEKSTVLVAPHSKAKALLETNLALNILLREYAVDRTAEMGKWLTLFLTGSAKDRYRFILENNPKLLDKLPLRLIASMIGITPTQLSRIRKNQ